MLTTEIAAVTSRSACCRATSIPLQAQLSKLESVLALQQAKLDRLTELFRLQTRRLVFLQTQYRIAIARLERRVVEIYTQDRPGRGLVRAVLHEHQ